MVQGERKLQRSLGKISEHHPRYREILDLQMITLTEHETFGQKLVQEWDQIQRGELKESSNFKVELMRSIIHIHKGYREERQSTDTVKPKPAHILMRHVANDPMLLKRLAEVGFLAESDLQDPPEILAATCGDQLLGHKKITQPLWIEIFRTHQAEFLIKKQALEAKLPTFIQQFWKRYVERIQISGRDVDLALVEQRLQHVHIGIVDPLIEDLRETHGLYNPNTNTVSLRAEYAPEEQMMEEEAITHELRHLTSGRTALGYPKQSDQPVPDNELALITHPRIGLSIAGPKYQRWDWLNEAITQKDILAQLERDPNSSHIYQSERQLYELVCTAGKQPIDPELFLAAYDENYHPTPGHQRLEHWRALQQALLTSYADPHFFVQLDNAVHHYGPSRAAELLRRGDFKTIGACRNPKEED